MRIEAIAWFDMPKNGKWHGQNVMPQQELIRCRDCYWYQESDTFKGMNCWHFGGMERPEPNDFCSWAERKEDD